MLFAIESEKIVIAMERAAQQEALISAGRTNVPEDMPSMPLADRPDIAAEEVQWEHVHSGIIDASGKSSVSFVPACILQMSQVLFLSFNTFSRLSFLFM